MLAPERPCRRLAIGQGELDHLERHLGVRRRRLERGHCRQELGFGDRRCLVVGPVVYGPGRQRDADRGGLGAGSPVHREGAPPPERLRLRVVGEHLRPRGRRAAVQPFLVFDPGADLADGEAGGAPFPGIFRSPVAGPLRTGQRLPQRAPGLLALLVVGDRGRAEERVRGVESEDDAVTGLRDDGDTREPRPAVFAVLVHEVVERQQGRVLWRCHVLHGQLADHNAGQQHLQLPALGRVLVLDGVAEVIGRGHRVGPAVLGDVLLADEPLHGPLDVLVGDLGELAGPLGGDAEAVMAHERRPVPAAGCPRRRKDPRGGAFAARELADPVGGPMQERQRHGTSVGDVVSPCRIERVRRQPGARQRLARQRSVGLRYYAQFFLHPREVLAIVGDQPVQRRADPLRSGQTSRRLADGWGHPERAAAPRPGQRPREHVEHVGERRRLVGEALDRVTPRAAGKAVAAAEPRRVLGSHLVEARRTGIAVEKVVQTAQRGDPVDERLEDRLLRVRGVASALDRGVGHADRHRGHTARQTSAVVGERGVGVLHHGAVPVLGLLEGGRVESLLFEAEPVEHHDGHDVVARVGEPLRQRRRHRGPGAPDGGAHHRHPAACAQQLVVCAVVVRVEAARLGVERLQAEQQRPNGGRTHHAVRETDLPLCPRREQVEIRRIGKAPAEAVVGRVEPRAISAHRQGRDFFQLGGMGAAGRLPPVEPARV